MKRRRQHPRGPLRQDLDAEETTPAEEEGPISTRTWKAESRTSQLAREQRRPESRRGNTDETGGKIRWNSQGAEERPSVGPSRKAAEAPRQTTGNRENLTNRNQEAGRGDSQEDHPKLQTESEERTGWAPRKTEELDLTTKAGESDYWTPTPQEPEGHKQVLNKER